MLISITEFKLRFMESSTKVKLMILAAPVLIGSGLYLYYNYFNTDSSNNQKRNHSKAKKRAKTNPFLDRLSRAIELKNEGNDFFRKKKFTDAIALYNEAILICPPKFKKELSTFYQNIAACFEGLKQYENVIENSTKAIELDKGYCKAYLRRGKANEILEQYENAVDDYFAAALSTNFEVDDYVKLYSDSLAAFADKKATEEVDKKDISIVPKRLLKEWFTRFSSHPLESNQNRIFENYDSFINNLINTSFDDLSIEDQLAKVTLELILGKKDAEDGLLKLTKMDINENKEFVIHSLILLIGYHCQRNRPEEAGSILQKAVDIDGDHPDVLFTCSQIIYLNGRIDECIEKLEKLVKLAPDFSRGINDFLSTRLEKSLLTNNTNEKDNVLKELEVYVKKFEKSPFFLISACRLYASNGDIKKAESLLLKAIEQNPRESDLYVHLADLCGDEQMLQKHIDKALELDDTNMLAYKIMADSMFRRGDFQGTISILKKALEKNITYEAKKALIFDLKTIELRFKALTTN